MAVFLNMVTQDCSGLGVGTSKDRIAFGLKGSFTSRRFIGSIPL